MSGRNRLILIGGGVRSGKSAFALSLARSLGRRRVYMATAEPGDAEMSERIARHRRERGHEFETVEEPFALAGAMECLDRVDVVLVDCLTFWVSNLVLQGKSQEEIVGEADRLLVFLAARPYHAVFVTNEVGMGVVPVHESARRFRDVCGMVHQRFSREADEVYFAALGSILRLKPALALVPSPDEGEKPGESA